MSVRSDISVDFNLSPRIITVASPSISLTIQDLHDTLRTIESYIWNMSYSKLISSAGKESLGGGVLVGITSTLQNAKVKFADRTGPSYTQCSVTGGNLVALDANRVTMSPIEPSAFTQVTLTSSSSATIAQLEIENLQYMIESNRRHHAGYGEILYWDPVSGDDNNSGTSPNTAKKTYSSTELIVPSSGATIFIVNSGTGELTISSRIVINKNKIRLRGSGSSLILKPNDTIGPTVTINGDDCYISGLRVQSAVGSAVEGIRINGSWASIEDIFIESVSGAGIYINGGYHHEILGCDITSCGGNGIHIFNSGRVRVSQSKSGSPNRIQRCSGRGIVVDSTSSSIMCEDILIEHCALNHNGPYEIEIKQFSSMTIIRKTVYASPWNEGGLPSILDNGVDTHNELIEMPASDASVVWNSNISISTTNGSMGKKLVDTLKLKRTIP